MKGGVNRVIYENENFDFCYENLETIKEMRNFLYFLIRNVRNNTERIWFAGQRG